MTKVIRIDPNGDVTECDGTNFATLAEAALGPLDMFSCQPITDGPPEFPNARRLLVGAVAEFSRLEPDAVVNPKAWALYGRSPLAGSVFFAHDRYEDASPDGDRPDFDPEFLERLRGDFVHRPIMQVDVMRSIAEREGLAWPE